MKSVLVLLVLGLVTSRLSGGDAAPADPPRVGSVSRNYKSYKLITPEPVEVDPELAARCAGVTESDVRAARKRDGVHAFATVSIYMNEPAARAFAQRERTYPEGSVVVKEKHFHEYQGRNGREAGGGDGVGGMIKRTAGFDPKHGDWEYFYFADPKRIESGRIASCVQCHAAAAETDHVFGTWARRHENRH